MQIVDQCAPSTANYQNQKIVQVDKKYEKGTKKFIERTLDL